MAAMGLAADFPIVLAGQIEFCAPVVMGTIQDVGTNEISGMVPVTGHDGCFWVHNDSNASVNEYVYAIHQSGFVVAEVTVAGARKGDWEDIAIGPGPEPDVRYLYIADTGTNVVADRTLAVWRIREPELPSLDPGQHLVSEGAQEIRIRYPAGIRDAEALAMDPATGTLYLLTKQWNFSEVYRIPQTPAEDGAYVLDLVRSFAIPHPFTDGDAVTGADVSASGTQLLLRAYTQILLFERSPEDPFESIFSGTYRIVPGPSEPQGESITWDHEGRDYLTVSEGASVPIYRMFEKIPHDHCIFELDQQSPLRFLRGDVVREDSEDLLAEVNITDAAELLEMVRGGGEKDCADAADIDDDGSVDAKDVETLLTALVKGTRLPNPFPQPGLDPTADDRRCLERDGEELVPEHAEYAYWYATDPPPAGWKGGVEALPDWPRGPGGIGFGADLLGTPLEGSPGLPPTLYARCDFSIGDPAAFDHLALAVDYAHGFAAYLNGMEVARKGLQEPGFAVPRDLPAIPTHRGGMLEEYLVCHEALRPGLNTLAIEVHRTIAAADPYLFFRSHLRGFRLAEPPIVVPPAEAQVEARLYLQHDGPLSPTEGEAIHVLLDTDSPVRGLSIILEYDPRHLRITGIRPSDWLMERTPWASYVQASRRSAALALLIDPDFLDDAVLPPGDGIPIADLDYQIIAQETTQTRLFFSERTGTLGLQTALSLPESGTMIPERVDFDVLIVQASPFLRGDANADGAIDISDAIGILSFLFPGGKAPPCHKAADVIDDGMVDITDGVALLNHLFLGGKEPAEPFTECGTDPTSDELTCEGFEPCQ